MLFCYEIENVPINRKFENDYSLTRLSDHLEISHHICHEITEIRWTCEDNFLENIEKSCSFQIMGAAILNSHVISS
jgi:porphobilinogen deaminase